MAPRSALLAIFLLFDGGELARGGSPPASGRGAPVRLDRHGDPLPEGAVARLGTLRLRHGGKIFALAFTPDGKAVASGGSWGVVRLWDVATGKERQSFPGHRGLICSLAFSPDGRRLAVADHRGWLAGLWSLPDGKTLYMNAEEEFPRRTTLPGRFTSGAVGFSPDGRTLATAGTDEDIRLWEVSTGKERHRFHGHRGHPFFCVHSVAFSPDGRRLASGGRDTTVLIWDVFGLPGRAASRPGELASAWDDLESPNAACAYAAVCRLSQTPGESVALLKKRLRPAPRVDPGHVARLVSDLDSSKFSVRDRATRELEFLGEVAGPALQGALRGQPSLEVRRRVERLLRMLHERALTGERLRAVRALEVLEHIGTPEVRQILEPLAQGAPGALLTREAAASLKRLGGKPDRH